MASINPEKISTSLSLTPVDKALADGPLADRRESIVEGILGVDGVDVVVGFRRSRIVRHAVFEMHRSQGRLYSIRCRDLWRSGSGRLRVETNLSFCIRFSCRSYFTLFKISRLPLSSTPPSPVRNRIMDVRTSPYPEQFMPIQPRAPEEPSQNQVRFVGCWWSKRFSTQERTQRRLVLIGLDFPAVG